MLKDLIILPDGTELFSGKVGENAIFDSTFTECVNSGEDLTLGSTCANMLEVTIWNPGSRLKINAGDELTLYKVDKTGERHKIGIFLAEKPERPSDNIMRLTCYDRIIKLDVDLTDWLLGLTSWPYTLLEFSGMVCEKCGLNFITTEVTNGDFPIYAYTKQGTTGRMLMQWLGEIAASFCRADRNGNVEFGWYELTYNIFTPNGGSDIGIVDVVSHYYQEKLTYSDYVVETVDAVQVQIGDVIYPEVDSEKNVYMIESNPFLYAAAASGDQMKIAQNGSKEKKIIAYWFHTPESSRFPPDVPKASYYVTSVPSYDELKYPFVHVIAYMGVWTFVACKEKSTFVSDGEKLWETPNGERITFQTTGEKWTNEKHTTFPEVQWFGGSRLITWANYDIETVNNGIYLAKGTIENIYGDETEEEPPDESEVINPNVLKPYIKNILSSIRETAYYQPFKMVVPAQLKVRAGDIFWIAYPNNPHNFFPTRCMIRTQKNQRDTLEATDSQRLDSVSAQYSGSGSGSSASSQISTTALKVVSTGQNVSMSINGGILTMTHNDEKVLEVKATDTVEAAILALKDALLAATGNLSIYAKGDLSIGCDGEFSLGNHLMSWKDNGDGTFTPIGTPKQ